MKYLKQQNDKLIFPPIYDTETGLVNCHLNIQWLLNNGFTQWSDQQIKQWYQQHGISTQIDTTAFDTACSYFRQVCQEIGILMENNSFKGSYDEMMLFYNSDAYKTDRGMQLAIAWSGCNDLCNYEGSKIGLESPLWFNKCWQGYEVITE